MQICKSATIYTPFDIRINIGSAIVAPVEEGGVDPSIGVLEDTSPCHQCASPKTCRERWPTIATRDNECTRAVVHDIKEDAFLR